MTNRRQVLRRLAVGAAWMGVSGIAPSRVLGANDRIRFGLIGAGGRGQAIFRAALRCPNTEAVAVADSYTMSVSMYQSEGLLFTWNSMFGNSYYGETHDYLLGTKGSVLHDESDEVLFLPPGRKNNVAEWALPPGYREWTDQHMQNFVDCVRSRKEPNCPFEMGYRTAIACQMAVASYRQQRAVRWDAQAEDIV